MKRNIKLSGLALSALLLLFALSSCKDEDFFARTNPPESPWQNITELERAVIGTYALFTEGVWGNPLASHRMVKVIGEDATYWIPGEGGNIPSDPMYFRKADQEIDKVINTFNTSYRVIANVNVALDFLVAHGGNPYPEASRSDIENNLPRIEGELLYLRAFNYWTMVTLNHPWYQPGGANDARVLPLRVNFPTTRAEASNSKIGTTGEIWQQVVADLTKAKSVLPEKYIAGVHHPSYQDGRVNKFGAAALLARVHFQMGNWAEATKELNFVIDQNGGAYDLSEEPIEAWNKDSQARGKEVLWYIPYHDPNNGGRTWLEMSSMNKSHYTATGGGGPASTGGNNSVCPWNGFTMSYDVLKRIGWMADPKNGNYTETEEAKKDKRYKQLYYRYEGYKGPLTPQENALGIWEARFSSVITPMVWGNKYYRAEAGRKGNIPVLRLAEMYLTRAIIRFREGDVTGATSDINATRRRAGLDPLATVTEEDIHNERIKEMSWEGDRIDYLRALKLPLTPGDRDPSLPNSTINSPYSSFVWPIPRAERDLNTGYGG